jgi:hypothetical protein
MGDWVPDEISLVVQHPVYVWTITEEVKEKLQSEQPAAGSQQSDKKKKNKR